MQRLIAIAAVMALPTGGAAFAVSDDVDVTASMPATCVLNRASADPAAIELTDLDGSDDDARANVVEGTYVFGDSYCNSSHQILVNAEAMTRDGTGLTAAPANSDTFDDQIELSVSFENWHSNVGTFSVETDVNNGIGSENNIPTFRNDAVNPGGGLDAPGFTVKVATKETTNPLLVGPYNGEVQITILATP